jgi:hypothetical protein
MTSLDDALAGSGAKSAFGKDSPIGAKISGSVVDATVRQINDYVSGTPKTWDNGDPQNQVVVRIKTEQRDDTDDDGIRGVYIKTWGSQKDALMAAVKAAGGTKASDVIKPGAIFTATYTGTEPSSLGSPAKVYAYNINPNGAVDDALTPPAADPASQQHPVQQAAQQVAASDQGNGSGGSQLETAKALIGLGQPDAAIAQVTGLDLAVVAALRNI